VSQPVPAKLKARRVRDHVETTLALIVSMRVRRDAARCRSIEEISWESHDLYTLALDTCEDEEVRDLVAQARAAILTSLTQ
jgi:hypothetical protein